MTVVCLRAFATAVLLYCLFSPCTALARPAPDLARLAREPTWLKLGHYDPDGNGAAQWRSAIHSPEFFLDPHGRTDPQRELTATLSAFAAPDPAGDQHAQCRFPARWLWLKSRLGEHPAFADPVECPGFRRWTRSGRVSSLSVIFATGYLGNPASYYGHTLLKFNVAGDPDHTPLLDVSVNYGAIVENDVDPVAYIVRSLTGGYDGGFSHIQFYFHNHHYGDLELRDLWEYRLDLPQSAVELIVAHAWELLGKRFTYHFFRLNCAYRMGELLQVAEGLNVIPDESPWVIPQALIQKLSRAEHRGRPVLDRVTYLPSRQSRFYERYRGLSATEVAVVEAAARRERTLHEPAFRAMPVDSQQRVLDTLVNYYQFVGNPLDKAPHELKQGHVAALAARFQLPPGAVTMKASDPAPPHRGRSPAWLQSGWGHQSGAGTRLSIRYRPAYYDPLDSDSGHVENSGLAMGDTTLDISRERLIVRRFDLFSVESANPGLSGMSGDNAGAMKVRVGAEQLRLSCDDCLAPRLQGDVGYGRQWAHGVYGAAYVGGAVHVDRQGQGPGFTRVSASAILGRSSHLRARLSHEYRVPLKSSLAQYSVTRAELRWRVGRGSDIRFLYERDGVEWFGVGHGIYW